MTFRTIKSQLQATEKKLPAVINFKSGRLSIFVEERTSLVEVEDDFTRRHKPNLSVYHSFFLPCLIVAAELFFLRSCIVNNLFYFIPKNSCGPVSRLFSWKLVLKKNVILVMISNPFHFQKYH